MEPPQTITTSKAWVLPPRSKPKTAKKKDAPTAKKRKTKLHPIAVAPIHTPPVTDVAGHIEVVDRENYQLKAHLLLLIHDYKLLRQMVLNKSNVYRFSPPASARKRLFTELGYSRDMSELIDNMSGLSHNAKNVAESSEDEDYDDDVFNYVNWDSRTAEIVDDDDDDVDSLSRTTSPVEMSEGECDNSLMTSLTRSTTVSTNNSSFVVNEKPFGRDYKFYDLPAMADPDTGFSFEKINPHDKMMSVIHEDNYNMVTDFLEERLIDNDVCYYVESLRQFDP